MEKCARAHAHTHTHKLQNVIYLILQLVQPLGLNSNALHPPTPLHTPLLLPQLSVACRGDGSVKFLTKGDNNSVDDRGLYAPGQLWLDKKDVVGRARG